MTCFPFSFGKKVRFVATHDPDIDEVLSGIQNVRIYTYKELKVASDNFSPANKIGQGGFGSVYKGLLKDGKVAAIKVLSAESSQGVKEFMTEINVISEIEHENLVKLYGCCVEGNQRILVYNYVENNSLAQTLLGSGHSNIVFDWKTRSRICIGIARGLAYLHEEVIPHIVHRDIKASNILLDQNLTPKISDFGLAKLIPSYMTHVSTRVAGTIGYLAPEYAIRGQLTRKADIYSFGVLLVEIVSGRCHTNSRLPIGEQYLLEMTWELYQKRELVGLVDISLDGHFDAEEACKFLKIGLLCTQDTSKLRPTMSSVVKMLTREMDIDESKITKPGLIPDFNDLKIKEKGSDIDTKASSSFYNASSASDSQSNTMSYAASTTTTFTAKYDQSNVAYRLQLPASSKIHPVFHYSLLRPHHSPLKQRRSPLPRDAHENHPFMEPLSILSLRLDSSTNPPTQLVLVQWIGFAPKDSTWEKWDNIGALYHLEDKVIFPGGGDDSKSPVPANHEGRPKRSTTRPAHLKDYV
ncbi:Cold-responsive protein kinase 1 [Glycine max]|nr:Cold-responsive protein kinase 1 [Glycine max]